MNGKDPSRGSTFDWEKIVRRLQAIFKLTHILLEKEDEPERNSEEGKGIGGHSCPPSSFQNKSISTFLTNVPYLHTHALQKKECLRCLSLNFKIVPSYNDFICSIQQKAH
jgi:hypothetical protein